MRVLKIKSGTIKSEPGRRDTLNSTITNPDIKYLISQLEVSEIAKYTDLCKLIKEVGAFKILEALKMDIIKEYLEYKEGI